MSYVHQWRVRFEEVDRIGVVNYPEVFNALQHGVEDLLIDIDRPYHRLVPEGGIALPIVHAEADYTGQIEHGDLVEVEITPTVGESSITFEGAGYADENSVFSAVQKQATIDFETGESIDVPDDLRDALEPYARG